MQVASEQKIHTDEAICQTWCYYLQLNIIEWKLPGNSLGGGVGHIDVP